MSTLVYTVHFITTTSSNSSISNCIGAFKVKGCFYVILQCAILLCAKKVIQN